MKERTKSNSYDYDFPSLNQMSDRPMVTPNPQVTERKQADFSIRHPKILVVDDDSEVNRLIATILKGKVDMECFTVEDEFQAMQKILKDDIDLALIDINLPNMNGFDLGIIFRTFWKFEIPIIYMSVDKNHQHVLSALNHPKVIFMAKPFDRSKLVAKIKKMLMLSE